MKAFPLPKRERDDLPRPYVANVINTLRYNEFGTWVFKKVNERHQLRAQQQDTIQMDPEIKHLFDISTATSGKCHQGPSLAFETYLFTLMTQIGIPN